MLLLSFGIAMIWASTKSLKKRLVSTEPDVRQVALKELASASPKTKAKIAFAMINTLKHPPFRLDFIDGNRRLSDWIQAAMARTGKPGVPILVRALREEGDYIRSPVMFGLEQMGPDASEAVPDLIAIYKNPGGGRYAEFTRQHALSALGGVGAESPEAISVLIEALGDEDPNAMFAAGYALVSRTPMVEAAFPVLVKKLEKGSSNALWSAECFGPDSKEVLPQLISALESGNNLVRRWAATAIGNMGAAAKDAVPALGKRLWDTDYSVRISALNSLSSLGEHVGEAVSEIANGLGNEDSRIRGSAAYALGKIGRSAKPAVPALHGALGDNDKEVRKRVAEALVRLGVDPGSVLTRSEVDALRPKEDDGTPVELVPMTVGHVVHRGGCQPREAYPPAVLKMIPPDKERTGISVFGGVQDDFCSSAPPGCKIFSKTEMQELFYTRIHYYMPQVKFALSPCRFEKSIDLDSLLSDVRSEWCARAEKATGRASGMELRINFAQEDGGMVGKAMITWPAIPGGPLGAPGYVDEIKLFPLRRGLSKYEMEIVLLEVSPHRSGNFWYLTKTGSGWSLRGDRNFNLMRACDGFWKERK